MDRYLADLTECQIGQCKLTARQYGEPAPPQRGPSVKSRHVMSG